MFKNISRTAQKSSLGLALFRNALVLAVFVLFFSNVFAVRLIDPLSKELSSSQSNFVGTVAPGNTIELIFSKELVDKYESLEMVSTLPQGFDYSVTNEIESIKLFISVPRFAVIGDYPISIVLSGPNRNDKVGLVFNVVRGGVDVSPSSVVEQRVLVDGKAEYKLFFMNNTDADAVFTLIPSLPANWVSENKAERIAPKLSILVPKRSSIEQSFVIHPRLEGKRNFDVNVLFENNSKQFSFAIEAKPTLKSKMEPVLYGVPFYSFSLIPSYFANGLLSFFLN
jgi:hypothetical protein